MILSLRIIDWHRSADWEAVASTGEVQKVGDGEPAGEVEVVRLVGCHSEARVGERATQGRALVAASRRWVKRKSAVVVSPDSGLEAARSGPSRLSVGRAEELELGVEARVEVAIVVEEPDNALEKRAGRWNQVLPFPVRIEDLQPEMATLPLPFPVRIEDLQSEMATLPLPFPVRIEDWQSEMTTLPLPFPVRIEDLQSRWRHSRCHFPSASRIGSPRWRHSRCHLQEGRRFRIPGWSIWASIGSWRPEGENADSEIDDGGIAEGSNHLDGDSVGTKVEDCFENARGDRPTARRRRAFGKVDG